MTWQWTTIICVAIIVFGFPQISWKKTTERKRSHDE